MRTTEKAFVLLLAVLVAGVLVSLGAAIFDIVSKEVLLSTTGKQSQFAFFVADTGVECALFEDYQQTTLSSGPFATMTPPASFNCGGATVVDLSKSWDAPSKTETADFSFCDNGSTAQPCASVHFSRMFDNHQSPVSTTIESRGHNTGNTASPIYLERAIRTTY